MPEMFSDRRQSIRYDVVTEVTVIHEHGRASVRTRDLSKGGLCMLLPYPLERGAPVRLELSLLLGPNAQSEPLSMKARVAWCAPENADFFQVGVSFLDLNEEEEAHLETFLEFLRQGFELSESERPQ